MLYIIPFTDIRFLAPRSKEERTTILLLVTFSTYLLNFRPFAGQSLHKPLQTAKLTEISTSDLIVGKNSSLLLDLRYSIKPHYNITRRASLHIRPPAIPRSYRLSAAFNFIPHSSHIINASTLPPCAF